MMNLKFKQLTESELSRICGGKWVNVDGKWIWVADHVIDDHTDFLDSVSTSRRDILIWDSDKSNA